MKLHNVQLEIILDAKDAKEAMNKVEEFLENPRCNGLRCNFLIHYADKDENFKTLTELRENQRKKINETTKKEDRTL